MGIGPSARGTVLRLTETPATRPSRSSVSSTTENACSLAPDCTTGMFATNSGGGPIAPCWWPLTIAATLPPPPPPPRRISPSPLRPPCATHSAPRPQLVGELRGDRAARSELEVFDVGGPGDDGRLHRGKPDDSDLETSHLEERGGPGPARPRARAFQEHVRGEEGKVRLRDALLQHGEAEVELVVAHRRPADPDPLVDVDHPPPL